MTESTPETIKRLQRAVRSEADDLEQKHKAERGGILREARKADADYQRGVIDGLRSAGDLLDG